MALTKVTGQVIKNTTDVTVGVLTVTNTLAVGGTVSIGGTLTYEDVTNVDAVGLITARNGIVVGSGITLSKDGDVFFTGIATGNGSGLTDLNASNLGSGTVPTARLGSGTASSSTFLRGDSTFAAVTSTTINSNADNRIITGSGTADTLNAESGLTYDGSNLSVTGGFDASSDISLADTIKHTGDTDTKIRFPAADTISLETSGSERFRIDSSGHVGINETSPDSNLSITDSENTTYDASQASHQRDAGATLRIQNNSTTTDSFAQLLLRNQSSNTGGCRIVSINKGNNASDLAITTGDTSERLRINSSGQIGIGANNNSDYDASAQNVLIASSGTTGITLRSGGSSYYGAIHFADGTSSSAEYRAGRILYEHSTDSLLFYNANTFRLKIKGDGDIGINVSNPGSRLAIYDDDGDCLLLASHDYSGEARIAFNGGTTTGGTLVNGSTCGAIGVTASAPGGAATGYMSLYTNNGDDLHEAVRIAADNTFHLASTSGDDVVYSLQTGRAQHSNGQSKTYRITGLAWGQLTFSIAVSDGNYKRAHVVVKLGGSQWATSNSAYVNTVEINDASGVNVSFNKETTYYDVTIANAGNSNTLYGAWQLEASMYSNLGKPTLTIS